MVAESPVAKAAESVAISTNGSNGSVAAVPKEGTYAGPGDAYKPIPDDEAFIAQSEDAYRADKALDKLLAKQLKDYPEFVHLTDMRVRIFWKRKGGRSKGVEQFGGIQRGNSLLRILGDTDYVVWVAADHCREHFVTPHQLNAIIYHQLCHTGVDEDGKPFNKGHDAEMFHGEIERFGLWNAELLEVKETVTQPELPGMDG